VEAFKEITILPGVDCCDPLNIIKSIPEFEGKQEIYVSFRQAAKAAYSSLKTAAADTIRPSQYSEIK